MRERERLKARERRAALAGTEKSEEKVLNSMFQPCEDMMLKSVEGKEDHSKKNTFGVGAHSAEQRQTRVDQGYR